MKFTILIFFGFLGVCTEAFTQNSIQSSSAYNFLYIKADEFKTLNKDKYVFQHYITASSELTMHGWEANGVFGRKFDAAPLVKLSVWKRSNVNLLNTYLGDIIITRHDLKRVKKKLTAKTLYVVLEPDNSKGFKYKILSTEDELFSSDLKTLAAPRLTDLNLSANPSPPKNFY